MTYFYHSCTVFLLSIVCLLTGCSADKPKQNHQTQTWKVSPQALQKSLFYTGNVAPLKEAALITPTDATVASMPFHYGEIVPQGKDVTLLDSNELQKTFNNTLTDYLKAKDNYNVLKIKFSGTQDLWESGLIAKNNYLGEKSSLNTAHIAFMQAAQALETLLANTGNTDIKDLTALNLTDFEQVKRVLNRNHKQFSIKAPFRGILLYPPKSLDNKEDNISIGSTLKSGQVLGLIGDISGIKVEINVPETDIDKVHVGMPAMITGIALGYERLQGKVILVNSQAFVSNNGLPIFHAVVAVKSLTPAQQNLIRVGMSANIELLYQKDQQLMIPIAAVHQKNGTTSVTIINEAGQRQERPITTGSAQADRVVILSGLKPGEVITYDA